MHRFLPLPLLHPTKMHSLFPFCQIQNHGLIIQKASSLPAKFQPDTECMPCTSRIFKDIPLYNSGSDGIIIPQTYVGFRDSIFSATFRSSLRNWYSLCAWVNPTFFQTNGWWNRFVYQLIQILDTDFLTCVEYPVHQGPMWREVKSKWDILLE